MLNNSKLQTDSTPYIPDLKEGVLRHGLISVHDQETDLYDQQVHIYYNHGHDVLFGMSFEYVNPGDYMLDLVIGTGLASSSFAKLGLNVYGCDGSEEMLKIK